MADLKVGERVGAIFAEDTQEKALLFFGFGSFVGEELPVKGVGPRTIEALIAKTEVPVIKLDGSEDEFVYGSECWWLKEVKAMAYVARYKQLGYKIVLLTPSELREQYRLIEETDAKKTSKRRRRH
jgi:hypothetical protein